MPTSSPLLQHPSQARIQWLNQASAAEALAWLDGIYEHSPWVAEQALAQRPFRSLAHLKWALAHSVMQADPAQQLALIKAHPLLAAKPNPNLTSELTAEQVEDTVNGLVAWSADRERIMAAMDILSDLADAANDLGEEGEEEPG